MLQYYRFKIRLVSRTKCEVNFLFQIDVFIREFSFTTMQIVGSILSVTALVILLLPVPEKSKPEEEKKVNLSDCEENDNKKDEILTDL